MTTGRSVGVMRALGHRVDNEMAAIQYIGGFALGIVAAFALTCSASVLIPKPQGPPDQMAAKTARPLTRFADPAGGCAGGPGVG